jgi:hypothetical protein
MPPTDGTSSIDDTVMVKRLNELVEETFRLWDEVWVGFSWRHYYYNHTQRVRALSLEIGRQEGADLQKLEYAAILHDITKRYDGPIITDSQGRRMLDENGFWRNELLMPKKENLVTRLYRKLDKFHQLHNVSGARIAQHILELYGFPADFCVSVSSIIKSHLNPDIYKEESSSDFLEKKILYEADTLDANLGLTAFYRNIQINTHYMTLAKGRPTLQQYISRIEPWIERKVAFLAVPSTPTGTHIAKQRLERMKETHAHILDELHGEVQKSLEYGLMGILKDFMDQNHDPNLEDEVNHLLTHWIPTRRQMVKTDADPQTTRIFHRAVKFCHLLSLETKGQA